MLARNADLLVKRNADGIDDWVRQVVDQLYRATVVLKSAVAVMAPIERINSKFEPFSDSNFDCFANKHVVPTGAVYPRHCVLEFNTARRCCWCLILISYM